MKEQEKMVANTDDTKVTENIGNAENIESLAGAGSAEAMNPAEKSAEPERKEPEESGPEKTVGTTETGEAEKINDNRAAAPKKRSWRSHLGNLLLLGGIAVICIPFVGRYLADRQQQQMLKEFYDQIGSEVGTEAEKLNRELGYTDDASLQGDLDASAKAIREIEQSEGLNPNTVTKLTTGPTAIGIIEIPKIKLKYPVAEGVDNVTLRFCIGHMPKTAGLGEVGNSVLAGHRSHSFGDFFNRLDELETGDTIWIKTKSSSTAYTVYEKKRVNKKDLSVLSQKGNDKVLTLITCELGVNPEERIIVKAKAEGAEVPAESAPAPAEQKSAQPEQTPAPANQTEQPEKTPESPAPATPAEKPAGQ